MPLYHVCHWAWSCSLPLLYIWPSIKPVDTENVVKSKPLEALLPKCRYICHWVRCALRSTLPAHTDVLLGLDLIYRGVTAAVHNRSLQFWEYLFSTFGLPGSPYTVEAQVGPHRFIFTADPENIKAILTTQFEDYGKGQRFHEEWKDFLGDSIFTTDGEQWHDSRSLIRPQFIKDRVSDLVTFEKHVNVLCGLMGGRGQEIDVSALFFRSASFTRHPSDRDELIWFI